jgi:hypothetical protein
VTGVQERSRQDGGGVLDAADRGVADLKADRFDDAAALIA